MLGQHPDVFITKPKEPAYFTASHHKGLEWYEGLFTQSNGETAMGEGSTSYSQVGMYPDAAARIADYAPAARILYLVRHPLERIVSGWVERKSAGHVAMPDDLLEAMQTVPGLLEASLYITQLRAYQDHFAHDQINVLFFEDLVSMPQVVMSDAFRFLGVDDSFFADADDTAQNAGATKRAPGKLLQIANRVPVGSRRSALRWVRRSAFGEMVARSPVRQLLDATLTASIDKPSWNRETRAWALAQLGDEPAQLLARYGKPADYWDL